MAVKVLKQMVQQLSKEANLLRAHAKGNHADRKILKCDACYNRPLTLKRRIEGLTRSLTV